MQNIRGREGSFVMALALASGVSTGVFAGEPSKGVICNSKSPTTNVRAGAGAKNFQLLGSLPNGTKVAVIESVKNDEGFLWHNVRYRDPSANEEKQGWVYSEAVAETCAADVTAAATAAPAKAPSTGGATARLPATNDEPLFLSTFTSKYSLDKALGNLDVPEVARTHSVFGLRLGQKMPSIAPTILRQWTTNTCRDVDRVTYTYSYDKTDPATKNGNYRKGVEIYTYNGIIGNIIIYMPPLVEFKSYKYSFYRYSTGAEYQNYGDLLKERYGSPLTVESTISRFGMRENTYTGKGFWFLPYTRNYRFAITGQNDGNQSSKFYGDVYIRAKYDQSDQIIIYHNEDIDKMDKVIEDCRIQAQAELIHGFLVKAFAPPSGGSSSVGSGPTSFQCETDCRGAVLYIPGKARVQVRAADYTEAEKLAEGSLNSQCSSMRYYPNGGGSAHAGAIHCSRH